MAHAQTIWVEAGTLTASIAAALVAEGRALAATASSAEARVLVERSPGALAVEVSRQGALLSARRVALDSGLQPALRVVVLLVADALSAPAPVEDAPPGLAVVPPPLTSTAAPSPPPRRVEGNTVSLGMALSLWAEPFAPELGPSVSVLRPIGPVRVGLELELLLAPALVVSGSIRGAPLSLCALGRVDWPVADVAGGELSLAAGAGVSYRRITGQVLSFGDSGEETQDAAELLLRGGVAWARPLLPWLMLQLGAGLEGRLARLRVTVPAVPIYPEGVLDPGPVAPWIVATLAYRWTD